MQGPLWQSKGKPKYPGDNHDGDSSRSGRNKFIQVEKNSYKFDCQRNLCERKKAVYTVSDRKSRTGDEDKQVQNILKSCQK